MSVLGIAQAGQRAAAMLMTDAGQLRRPGPPGAPDPVTGVIEPSHTVVYEGPGRVKALARQGDGVVNAGEARDSQAIYVVSLPVSVADARPGDVWVVTSSADPATSGRVFRVAEVEGGSQVTARRLICDLVEARQP